MQGRPPERRGGQIRASSELFACPWRHHIDVAVRDAVLHASEPELLWILSGQCPDDATVHETIFAVLRPQCAS
jgi:hypothetical protein